MRNTLLRVVKVQHQRQTVHRLARIVTKWKLYTERKLKATITTHIENDFSLQIACKFCSYTEIYLFSSFFCGILPFLAIRIYPQYRIYVNTI